MDIASWSAFLPTGVREAEARSPEESPKMPLFSSAPDHGIDPFEAVVDSNPACYPSRPIAATGQRNAMVPQTDKRRVQVYEVQPVPAVLKRLFELRARGMLVWMASNPFGACTPIRSTTTAPQSPALRD